MRTIAMATALVLGMTIGSAEAQYVGIPKTFQPSLAAEAKRVKLKNPPLTTAPDVKTTLYRIGDALGMLRGTDERDAILTMDWRGTGTMNAGGQPCRLASYRGSVRYDVPALRVDFSCAQADGKPGDPRLSLEERYGNREGYVAAVTKAARALEAQRLLLPVDVQRYIEQAQASTVLR